jgi:hypothetical protein
MRLSDPYVLSPCTRRAWNQENCQAILQVVPRLLQYMVNPLAQVVKIILIKG